MRLLPSLLLGTWVVAASATADETALHALAALLDDHAAHLSARAPPLACNRAERRIDDRQAVLDLRALERGHRAERNALRALGRLDPAVLPAAAVVDQELLRRDLALRVALYGFGQHLLPMTRDHGVQLLYQLAEPEEFVSAEEYDRWIARLQNVDEHVAQTIALMRRGMRQRIVIPDVVMRHVPAQVRSLLVERAEDSALYLPFTQMPERVHPARAQALRAAARTAITERALPAYRRLHAFLVEEYLPATRDSIAASALPDGAAYYRMLVAWYTGTELSPEEIHQIGLDEVERIAERMRQVQAASEIDGELRDFLLWLREHPSFVHREPERLLEAYRATAKRIDPELPLLFSRLPRMPYGVRMMSVDNGPGSLAAYYRPPRPHGHRSGFIYVNSAHTDTRSKFTIEALSMRHGVPGDHLRVALTGELQSLHPFRRQLPVCAFSEGWALYAEGLGESLGLYRDPHTLFGRLSRELWHAARLVTDTGMHAMQWSRDEAISLLTDLAAWTEQEVIDDIDRQIASPGQALAAKLGEIHIRGLRARAEQTLGGAFDIRVFHDVLLSAGPLPPDLLEQHVDAWLALEHNTIDTMNTVQ